MLEKILLSKEISFRKNISNISQFPNIKGIEYIYAEYNNNCNLIKKIKYYFYYYSDYCAITSNFYSYELLNCEIKRTFFTIYMQFIKNLYLVYYVYGTFEYIQIISYDDIELIHFNIPYIFINNKKKVKLAFRKYKCNRLIKDNYFLYIEQFDNIIQSYKLLYSL